MYALIMAGGSGTRLWPCSRETCPKQLLGLLSERTMLQEAYQRITPLIPSNRIFVVTSEAYTDVVRQQIPQVPAANIIGELEGHGTAPCIGLSALHLKLRDPEAVMAVLTADHYIEKADELRRALEAAAQLAEEGHLVTMGIQPNRPATGYGYIQRGERLAQVSGHDVYRVEKFTEKPDLTTTQVFIDSGRYYWNSGMFIWKVSTILREFKRLMPQLYAQLMEIDAALGTAEEQAVLERVWAEVENETIDYGIMERAEDVAVIPVDIGWSDVGSWVTLFELLPADGEGNVVVGQHVGLDTTGCLIHGSRRLVTTIGLEDMVVVDTEDALLVCPRERAQEVRDLVEKLKESGKEEYL
ncbi:MAG: mannose-1-phosphate guanylyltransferase [Anaerolineae bacterium]